MQFSIRELLELVLRRRKLPDRKLWLTPFLHFIAKITNLIICSKAKMDYYIGSI